MVLYGRVAITATNICLSGFCLNNIRDSKSIPVVRSQRNELSNNTNSTIISIEQRHTKCNK